ncbi:hypothetical protein [Bacillus sp. FJAT-45037]|uniref:hypothetical protein n=1 Tax=Bacillus sp. FJAT-45037 TaxID=2011007 RepID=UPI000C2371D4|nr:hypothetical protein [Bacillus sp. FJAT-45037]
MIEKLNLKHSLQWLSLVLLNMQPLTPDECYDKLIKTLPPPPQPGSPTRKYSKDKVRAYLKELESLGTIVSIKEAGVTSYSITKKGYNQEEEWRNDLLSRMKTIQQSLHILLDRMNGKTYSEPVMVPKEDREFVRSLITIKDVIRFYIIDSLQKEKSETLTNLHRKMLNHYGWTCSPSYFLLVGRNEMCEGVDSENNPLKVPVILLKSQYGGNANRSYTRVYSLSDPVAAQEWKEIYATTATDSIQEALIFTNQLMGLLREMRTG